MATSELGDSLLNFSIDLYKQLASRNGSSENIVYSPFSISAALHMALAGARNVTAKQLADVLHVNGDEVHQNFSDFRSKLTGLAPGVKLRVANRMYAEQTLPVLDSYLALIRDSYGATVESVDFRNNSEKVRQRVNAWVEQVTESKIRDLLQPGSVNGSTILVLVNAVYFKGLWESQFEPELTERSEFHLGKKNTTKVDMMYKEDDYKMGRSDDLAVRALELPYRGGRASMVILLPDDIEGLPHLEERLTFGKLSHLLNSLTLERDVQLCLPKFKLEQTINLKQMLTAMGIEDFFTEAADLTGICEKDNASASEVYHKTFVEVNEEGTVAASATALEVCDCAALDQTVFIVNRPFMFLIQSSDPEAVLFMGSVRTF
ncbi:leukocyte elastase inhibitor isoform X4 [Rhipicephalus sanguineus]|uniref:Serpin domain-containing protein n=1 Tax=Rhipicephalus sanguineus TaxID=34632 RepID=A0A9D4T4Z9_RHISA|nr:leukocyte elastase inhibitor isoform X4 [Rhipicephalus sanguineus]KAH7973216.1 hypothetical protein HPB52_023174 [Rhipicephalus sanguineus]